MLSIVARVEKGVTPQWADFVAFESLSIVVLWDWLGLSTCGGSNPQTLVIPFFRLFLALVGETLHDK